MKILLIADEEDKSIWDYYRPEKLAGVELILSAGDLKPEYLSFLVTMLNRPLLYVHGNHDHLYDVREPEGCECIDDRIVTVNGLRIMGLGGSKLYSRGSYQYSERQMCRRIRKLRFQLWRKKGVDIILTHAPAEGYGDMPDPTHKGFGCFVELIDKYKPRYLVHGHVHKSYNYKQARILHRGETEIINACGKYIIEI